LDQDEVPLLVGAGFILPVPDDKQMMHKYNRKSNENHLEFSRQTPSLHHIAIQQSKKSTEEKKQQCGTY